jgi:hypothetical protein
MAGPHAGIAEALQIGVDAVRRWRRRFATATGERVEALIDRPRIGRQRVHGPAVRAEQPLGPNDFVICADEKTSIQARCRRHPTLPPGKARMIRT